MGMLLRTAQRYASVDWSKTSPQIADQLGVTVQSIKRLRKTYGHVPNFADHFDSDGKRLIPPGSRFAGLDWTKPDAILAAEIGENCWNLRAARRRYGIPPATPRRAGRKPPPAEPPPPWNDIDWSLPTRQIAAITGKSNNAVRYARRLYGKPAVPSDFARFVASGGVDWRLRNSVLAQLFGISGPTVHEHRKKLAAPNPSPGWRYNPKAFERLEAAQRTRIQAWRNEQPPITPATDSGPSVTPAAQTARSESVPPEAFPR